MFCFFLSPHPLILYITTFLPFTFDNSISLPDSSPFFTFTTVVLLFFLNAIFPTKVNRATNKECNNYYNNYDTNIAPSLALNHHPLLLDYGDVVVVSLCCFNTVGFSSLTSTVFPVFVLIDA